MTIDEIRERIAISMDTKCDYQWSCILDNTNPAHCGFRDLGFQLATNDVWVEIPKKTFTFQKGALSFTARLGSSNERDGVDVKVRKTVSGSGTFDFDGSFDIQVIDFKINEGIDLVQLGGVVIVDFV
jgi:hypothetical protein